MRTITLNIPDDVNLNEQEVLLLLASSLHEHGRLSLGQAAELAGLSKHLFAEMLSSHGVSIFNYSAHELTDDVTNA